jgi:hypothetical protein
MSSLYFGLDVFCQFEARVSEYEAVFIVVECTLYSPQLAAAGLCFKFWKSSLKKAGIQQVQNTMTTSLL